MCVHLDTVSKTDPVKFVNQDHIVRILSRTKSANHVYRVSKAMLHPLEKIYVNHAQALIK